MTERTFINSVVGTYKRQNARAIGDMKVLLYKELEDFTVTKDGNVSGSAATKEKLTRLRNRISIMFGESGFGDGLAGVTRSFEKVLDYQSTLFESYGYDIYGADDLVKLDVMRESTYDEFNTTRSTVTDSIRKALTEAQLGKISYDDMAGKIDGALGTARGWGYTIGKTAMMSTAQEARNQLGKALGVKYWIYDGGIRKNTRPFCYAILKGRDPNSNGALPDRRDSKEFAAWFAGLKAHSNSWTVEEIGKLNNGMLDNVMRNRGGYNCGHTWRPVAI